MSQLDSATGSQADSATDSRYLPSGEEAGSAPDDRRFRPDVEGLRAVAVVLVVLYHANLPGLTGGYVGVDVFFVISGFVITGLLLRERSGAGRTSIVDFYARRVRRILPAATLVILVTVIASYVFLGYVDGNNVADDGRWAAIFLANYHFLEVGTNYLQSLRPPSPLQHFWSLSVEEQFYVVFPTLFLVVAGLRSKSSTRVAPGRRAGRHRHRFLRLVDRPDQRASGGGVLLALHPGLGAGTRRLDRREHPVAQEAREPARRRR